MDVTRRKFLLTVGVVTAGAALEVGGLILPEGLSTAYADDVPTGTARGLFSGWTTLDRTVKQPQRQDMVHWSDYVKLVEGPGEAHVVRTDLAPGAYAHPTRAIDAFVQITDMQIVDEKSPGRVEFTDRWANLNDRSNPDTESAYRPQEMLSTQIVEAMARAIRNVARGPMTGLTLTFTIATGDMVDNVQYNETRWYIDLLDGGHPIQPESGIIGGLDSVSDLFSEVSVHDPAYWSPEGLLGGAASFDHYRFGYNFPIVHGLLPAARRSFTSTGLGMPWYAAMGNHDGEIQGNYPVHPTTLESTLGELPDIFDHATMAKKPLSSASPLPPNADPSDVTNFINDLVFRAVAPDQNRRFLTRSDFAAEHFLTTGTPVGHGFINVALPFAGYLTYYSRPAPNAPMQYITLDTVNYDGNANGRIPANQYAWLESELKAHSKRYYDDNGAIVVQNGVTDRLVVLFAHHTIDSIDNDSTDQVDIGDPDFYYSKSVEKLLLRYPNVILFVCGHTHRNDVLPHRRGVTTSLGNVVPGIGGFWEVTTASHIDWPVQSRVFELATGKGHVSIMTTMVDIAAPLDYAGDLSSPVSLASLARELAANDPTERPANSNTPANPDGESGRRGHGDDRNLQLLVPAPFFLGVPDEWGSSIAVTPDNLSALRVFGTRTDDSIRMRPEAATDWSAFPTAGTMHAVAAEVNLDGRMELFGLGAEQFGRVWHSVQSWAGAAIWSGLTFMGDVNARSVAAARHGDGRLEVFVTTAGGDVWHIWQTSAGGNWSTWSIGFGLSITTFFTQAAAAANTDGRVEVFGLSSRGELWRRAQTLSGGWTGWVSMGNLPTARFTKLAAAQNANGRLALFLVDHDWRVWRTSQISAGSSGWSDLQLFDEGRTRMTQIAARRDGTSRIALFGVDNAGQVWTRRQASTDQDAWSAWSSWSTTGTLRADVPIVPGSSNTNERIIMPNLIGLTEDAARTTVDASGLILGVVGHQANPAPAGTVFAQSPTAPGQVAFERDTANYSVSLGAVTVPDVVSWTRTAAMNKLAAVGLVPTYSVTPSNLTHDDVLTQSPAVGTVVQPGAVVHLTVASGPTGGGGGGNNPPQPL